MWRTLSGFAIVRRFPQRLYCRHRDDVMSSDTHSFCRRLWSPSGHYTQVVLKHCAATSYSPVLWTVRVDYSERDPRRDWAFEAVAEWWTQQLCHRGMLDNGDLYTSVFASMLAPPVPASDEAATLFRQALIAQRSERLGVDYGPDRRLAAALEAAGVTAHEPLPWKTHSWVDGVRANVVPGRRAPTVVLYDGRSSAEVRTEELREYLIGVRTLRQYTTDARIEDWYLADLARLRAVAASFAADPPGFLPDDAAPALVWAQSVLDAA